MKNRVRGRAERAGWHDVMVEPRDKAISRDGQVKDAPLQIPYSFGDGRLVQQPPCGRTVWWKLSVFPPLGVWTTDQLIEKQRFAAYVIE